MYCTGNAEQAMSLANRHHVDLLLSDVVLPGMDGYRLAAKIMNKHPAIKIQMMSGYTSEYGANLNDKHTRTLHEQRLHKPFNPEALLIRIKALLEIPVIAES